ncbi:MAG TPA: hypothetical protein VJ843_01360 [Candidatus Saccharimonadales bacterium]|nr:hypothetical protein [Candidatus Saccharimonadales bacterium]
METIESTPTRPRPVFGRNYAAILISALLVSVLASVGLTVLLMPPKVVTHKVAVQQDCAKPGTTVGALCASVQVENGVTVTRTYVTQSYDFDGGRYAYLRDKSVQLNYGDTATIDNLCVAGAVATTTDEPKEHPYTREYSTMKKEFCDPAQKALDAGNSDTCFMILNDASGLAPLAFSPANIDDACTVPVQPKAKSALVSTSRRNLLNGTPFYVDPSASPSNN